jgi:hypothetical protein
LEYYNGTNYLTNSLVTITTTGQTGSLTNDIVIFNPPSSTALTYTLPDPTVTYGKTITYRISKSVAALNASVVLTAPGSNTVDGAATFTLACIGDFVTLVSNGTDWVVTNKPTGLLPLANTTVTAATAVTYDNMFHSKYSAYVIEVYLKNAGGTGGYTNTWRLRSGGATVTGANYTSFGRYVGSGIGSQADFTANTNETSWGGSANMYNFTGAGDYISITGEIVNPTSNTIATRLTLNGPYTYGGGVFASYANGFYKDVTQVADGWVYTSVSGTVSGNVKVYARCVL